MIQNLAQQIEALRSGTTPGRTSSEQRTTTEPASSENSVPVVMEVQDLKQKVAHLIEQLDQHNREIGQLAQWCRGSSS